MFKQSKWPKTLIFEKSTPGRTGYQVPELSSEEVKMLEKAKRTISSDLLRENSPNLPEVSELEVVRHFTRLSQMNYGVDSGFYPLGSCTMKYNPKICDTVASMNEAQNVHPYQPEDTIQGSLQIMYELAKWLAELSGMAGVTLQPAAGAHGEYTGIMILRKYHESQNNLAIKNEIIVPDSAHGTNPATVSMCGFKTIVIPSNNDGCVNIDALRSSVTNRTAGMMLTNPNTLGIFEPNIKEITDIIHGVDGLMYYDGANFNAIMGKVRPGDMGFDIVHFNIHKTFATPHGGGGPGAGPVGVVSHLIPFLPVPSVAYNSTSDFYYFNYDHKQTIGKVRSYFGNFSILLRAYSYILRLGQTGLTRVSEMANLNANYMKAQCARIHGFSVPYGENSSCMHEFVLSAKKLFKETEISALDISKYLLDNGFHPPTVYFPLIVPEALMIEPTETEPKEIIDDFIQVIRNISKLAYSGKKEGIQNAPINTSVGRIDDVKAARDPIISYRMLKKQKKD
ncbi:glycine dehydrogenase (aminomethyl-transferring) [Candidatus Heimdallarchaeota archaeon B3_Heim]|nr:MAG: glycine dehydrogenase (aminomethyl-transferring) [Candidatus Heimdallarchaeota archaeon B3_Heim]